VLEPSHFAHDRWLHSRQITDAYLLALAVHRDGVFVTLDRGIDISLVTGAMPRHLVTL
jgi:predicted nucleic acid-binding protein